jgi:hypothetical protein
VTSAVLPLLSAPAEPEVAAPAPSDGARFALLLADTPREQHALPEDALPEDAPPAEPLSAEVWLLPGPARSERPLALEVEHRARRLTQVLAAEGLRSAEVEALPAPEAQPSPEVSSGPDTAAGPLETEAPLSEGKTLAPPPRPEAEASPLPSAPLAADLRQSPAHPRPDAPSEEVPSDGAAGTAPQGRRPEGSPPVESPMLPQVGKGSEPGAQTETAGPGPRPHLSSHQGRSPRASEAPTGELRSSLPAEVAVDRRPSANRQPGPIREQPPEALTPRAVFAGEIPQVEASPLPGNNGSGGDHLSRPEASPSPRTLPSPEPLAAPPHPLAEASRQSRPEASRPLPRGIATPAEATGISPPARPSAEGAALQGRIPESPPAEASAEPVLPASVEPEGPPSPALQSETSPARPASSPTLPSRPAPEGPLPHAPPSPAAAPLPSVLGETQRVDIARDPAPAGEPQTVVPTGTELHSVEAAPPVADPALPPAAPPTSEPSARGDARAPAGVWVRTVLEPALRTLPVLAAAGEQALQLRLEGSDGTLTVRTRREGDRIEVVVTFSDGHLQAAAVAATDRLRAALQEHFGTEVEISLLADTPQDGGRRDHADDAPAEAPSRPAPAPAPTAADPASPTRPAGARNEWIG